MPNDQIKLWTSKFGNDYVKRNHITEADLEMRKHAWNRMLKYVISPIGYPASYLEVGAGQGINLLALSELHNNSGIFGVEFGAVEPNKEAYYLLKSYGIKHLTAINDSWPTKLDKKYDVVFTSGVLIHVHPDNLKAFMQAMHDASNRYIICVEYFAAERVEKKYHNTDSALWLDDYGKLWLDNFKLRCVDYGFFWKKMSGLDNLTYWVFEKVN